MGLYQKEAKMKVRLSIALLLLAAAGAAQAQYKYIGPDGRVVYSDQPPPPSAKVLEKKPLPGSAASAGELPFALQSAMKTFPVTLFTAPNCGAPCSDGRTLLNQRGIPFTEKTVKTAEDAAAFQKQTSSQQLPVLLVGSGKQPQFDRDAWTAALDAAGYPATSQLPKDYRNPAPTSVAQASSTPGTTAPGQTAVTPVSQGQGPAPESGGDKPAWFKGF
jgi:Domain of unknown function (DUF4124)